MPGYDVPDLSALYTRLGPEICTYDASLGQLTLLRETGAGEEGVPFQKLSIAQSPASLEGVELVVAYSGNDRAPMLRTLEALHLQNSWPSNFGEKPFYLLRGELMIASESPFASRAPIVLKTERQLARLEQVLRRFHAAYSRN